MLIQVKARRGMKSSDGKAFVKTTEIVDCAKYNKWKDVEWMDLMLRGCDRNDYNRRKTLLKQSRYAKKNYYIRVWRFTQHYS